MEYSSRIFKLLIKFRMLNKSSEQPCKGKCLWWLPTWQNITLKAGKSFQFQQLFHNIQRHFYPGVTSFQCIAAEIHTAGHKRVWNSLLLPADPSHCLFKTWHQLGCGSMETQIKGLIQQQTNLFGQLNFQLKQFLTLLPHSVTQIPGHV